MLRTSGLLRLVGVLVLVLRLQQRRQLGESVTQVTD